MRCSQVVVYGGVACRNSALTCCDSAEQLTAQCGAAARSNPKLHTSGSLIEVSLQLSPAVGPVCHVLPAPAVLRDPPLACSYRRLPIH